MTVLQPSNSKYRAEGPDVKCTGVQGGCCAKDGHAVLCSRLSPCFLWDLYFFSVIMVFSHVRQHVEGDRKKDVDWLIDGIQITVFTRI